MQNNISESDINSAYIAASRRSDRSLEARVESARRASEIHKRRTGRSLRVTEQDVVNEEMYEEEDDDLPMQYRRLTAHLQTSNADFDRRLAAYLTNHVAMRTALGQAVTDSYGQPQPQAQPQSQYTNPLQFSHQSLFSNQSHFAPTNPILAKQLGLSNQALHGSMSHRATPYPISNEAGRRASMQSFASQATGQQANTQRNASISNLGNLKLDTASPQAKSGNAKRASPVSAPAMPRQQQPSTFPVGSGMNFDNLTANNPFSTSLPLESQQLLAGAFDPNDPMTSMLMGNDFRMPQQPSYNLDYLNRSNDVKYDPSMLNNGPSHGIDQTLSPGMLDISTDVSGFGSNKSPSADTLVSPFTSTSPFHNGFDPTFSDLMRSSGVGAFGSSSGTSSQATPNAEKDWQSLFDGNLWEADTMQQPTTA